METTTKHLPHDKQAKKYVLRTILFEFSKSLCRLSKSLDWKSPIFICGVFLEGEREKPCAVLADVRKI